MIFYKWGVDWAGQDYSNYHYNTSLPGTQGAPVLLNELIFMFLPSGGSDIDKLYSGQSKVQTAMVVLAGISLPWMLFKPIIELCIHKNKFPCIKKELPSQNVTTINLETEPEKSKDSSSASLEEENDAKVDMGGVVKSKLEHPGELEFEFGEACIHNLLETIEFVLGSVSHTASYLRLWALSLAHSELATVFWQKVMFQVLQITADDNIILIALIGFAGFSVWFAITLMVMMFMELLSALLHALRLHWVEFQSKFYKGDGIPFKPFSLRKIHSSHHVMHLATKGID